MINISDLSKPGPRTSCIGSIFCAPIAMWGRAGMRFSDTVVLTSSICRSRLTPIFPKAASRSAVDLFVSGPKGGE